MKKEDILTWLITFGREWVGINDLYQTYKTNNEDLWSSDFRDMLEQMHNAMYTTKRTKLTKSEIQHRVKGRWYEVELKTEQYRLTERAINSLNE